MGCTLSDRDKGAVRRSSRAKGVTVLRTKQSEGVFPESTGDLDKRGRHMQMQEVSISNRLGLHARACAKIVQVASRFPCDFWITAKGRRASARNILAVMLLSASLGTVVRLEADGPGEVGAMREISALFQNGFGESS